MNRKRSIGAAIGLTALLITSAAAQTPAGQGDGAVPAVGSLLKVQNNYWRGVELIGTPVFGDNGLRIATVDDLLITDDGKVDRVVLSVRGRRQLVAVPLGSSVSCRAVTSEPRLDGEQPRALLKAASGCSV